MIDLKHEIERELSLIDPPDLWDRIQADASDNGGAAVLDLTTATRRRTTARWLAAVAAVAVLALVSTVMWLDDDQSVDTTPATEVPVDTTPAEVPVLPESGPSGPDLDRGTVVHRMTGVPDDWAWWEDPLDAAEGFVDVERVTVQPADQVSWTLELAAGPPAATDREPGLLIAYGLVLDTTGDGVADYVVGIDNDTPVQGDFHVWLTDLATGGTHERFGPPYGFPIETWYPDVPGSTTMLFTFLLGTAPRSLDPETVRFYAWTTATRDGELVANDYAPDTGWISAEGAEPP